MSLDFEITKNSESFDADIVRELKIFRELHPISEAISADTMTFTTDVSAQSQLPSSQYGDKFEYSKGGQLQANYYFKSLERAGRSLYRFNLISDIGLTITAKHRGGIYNGAAASDILADIFDAERGGAVYKDGNVVAYMWYGKIKYFLDVEVGDVKLYGWLAYQSMRDAFLQVLFALGAVAARRDSIHYASWVHIKYPRQDSVKNISDDRIYIGGRVKPLMPATLVRVTEHSYRSDPSDPQKELFNNSDGFEAAVSKEIIFDGPMHDLSVTGTLTIDDSGVNYAVVSGTGTLTGLEYTHLKYVLDWPTGINAQENIITVEDATLVSMTNSRNVAARVASFYSTSSEVIQDIVLSNERPGDYVRLTSPYGDKVQGIIKSQDINVSGIDKALTTVLAGFVPGPFGANITECDILTTSGTYTVPADIDGALTLVLVGGGQGGQGGQGGRSGTDSNGQTNGKGGFGGEPGLGGTGGKILVVTIENPAASYSYTIGEGGAPGAGGAADQDGALGSEGTASTFGPYTSENGTSNPNGVQNPLDPDDICGIPGLAGDFAGAPGGDGSSDGSDLDGNTGGTAGTTATESRGGGAVGVGGGGGGAAKGNNGSDGSDGRTDYPVYIGQSPTPYAEGYGGGAGRGADAVAPSSSGLSNKGAGGRGGRGGGGGGGGGGFKSGSSGLIPNNGKGAPGGNGSAGTAGNPGVIFALYKRLTA